MNVCFTFGAMLIVESLLLLILRNVGMMLMMWQNMPRLVKKLVPTVKTTEFSTGKSSMHYKKHRPDLPLCQELQRQKVSLQRGNTSAGIIRYQFCSMC